MTIQNPTSNENGWVKGQLLALPIQKFDLGKCKVYF